MAKSRLYHPTREELEREYGYPVRAGWFGEPIPDLARIPRERWPEVLASVSLEPARRAIATTTSREDELVAAAIVFDQDAGPGRSARRRVEAPAIPRPVMAPAARAQPHRSRQVNVRLYERDFARLERAAELFGARPTELARSFIVSGTARTLAEVRQTRARTKPA